MIQDCDHCECHLSNMIVFTYFLMSVCSAEDANICLVNEVGVDPGIDHMLAMQSFSQIKAEGGKVSTNIPRH